MDKKIAILGATSQIAKGLICNFSKNKYQDVYLFARSKSRLGIFLKQINCAYAYPKKDFIDLHKQRYDVIINCVGLGTPIEVKAAGGGIFKLTEEFDNLILEYLRQRPGTLYINFSSGAVYGNSFNRQVSDNSELRLRVNDIKPENYYGLAKLYSEAKHRALGKLSIVDIRVFSYFSRFIDLNGGYFLTELLKSLKNKKTFVTNPYDFVRDFLSSDDLFKLICLIIKVKPFNGVIDVYSLAPVRKFDLLDYFVKNYALKYSIDHKLKLNCPTGTKSFYRSNSKKALKLGYKPSFSSLKTVAIESEYILKAVNEQIKP